MNTSTPNSYALSEINPQKHSIEIDGMKVIFHETVGLLSTELVSSQSRPTTRKKSKSFSIPSRSMSLPPIEFIQIQVDQENLTLDAILDAHWSYLTDEERETLQKQTIAKNPSLHDSHLPILKGTTILFPHLAIEVGHTRTLSADDFQVECNLLIGQIVDAQQEALSSFKKIFTMPDFEKEDRYPIFKSLKNEFELVESLFGVYGGDHFQAGYEIIKYLIEASSKQKKPARDPAKNLYSFINQLENNLSELIKSQSNLALNMKLAYIERLKELKTEEKIKDATNKMYIYMKETLPSQGSPLIIAEYYLQQLIEEFMVKVVPNSKIYVSLIHKPNKDKSITYLNSAKVEGTGVDAKLANTINNLFIGHRTSISNNKYQYAKNIPLLRLKVNKHFVYRFGNIDHTLHIGPDNFIKGRGDALHGMQYLRGTKDSDLYSVTLYSREEDEAFMNKAYGEQYYKVKTRMIYPKKLEEI